MSSINKIYQTRCYEFIDNCHLFKLIDSPNEHMPSANDTYVNESFMNELLGSACWNYFQNQKSMKFGIWFMGYF